MRTKLTIRNSIISLILSLLTMIIGFISQAIFIRLLEIEYLGLNGLFSNILNMLNIFELGLGSTIVYNLYKPIALNNYEEIKSLMSFYKKAYKVITVTIFLIGLTLIPFLHTIVGDINVDINLEVIYILFLISTVSSYVFAYKRSIIYANQKNYLIDLIHMAYIIILNFSQLLVLYFFKNYYLYLVLKIVCLLIENIILGLIADKMYPYIKEKNVKKLDKEIEDDIFKKVKALIFHKIGSVIVLGTDNIIISIFLGIKYVGIYSNYYLIINTVNTYASQIISASVASIGNLLVTENSEKTYSVFKKIRFLNYWIACVSGTSILVLINPFIKIWIGKDYLLPFSVIIVLVINYYQKVMRRTFGVFKDAAGIWIEDKYVPLIESIINIIFSILFVNLIGLSGVFLGTIISGFALWCYSYPKYVYKKLFNGSYKRYAFETIIYLVFFILIATFTYCLSEQFIIENLLYKLVINAGVCLIVPNIIILVIYYDSDEYKYFKNLLKGFLNKVKKERVKNI